MKTLQNLFLFSSALLFLPILCIPITRTAPSYVPDPNMRGTIGLLWSCTITFGSCIWTAIHPNVVPVQRARVRIYYKLMWMLLAVLFPEVVTWYAVAQLGQAKQLHRSWQEYWGKKEKEGREDKKKEYKEMKECLGKPGAFFAVMGGFVIKKGRESKFVTTVFPAGFKKLLDDGAFDELANEGVLTEAHFCHRNIKDKGKADSVSKALVSIQILWMVIQCIGRKVAGLPITLLEIHVMIQISYAVVVYFCWWDKPLDVAQPITLPVDVTILSKYGHDIEQETTVFSRELCFITERKNYNRCSEMFLRTVSEITLVAKRKGEFWVLVMALISSALHATAWKSHFPTSTERLLWRMSALGIGVVPSILSSILWITDFEQHLQRRSYNLRFEEEHLARNFFDGILKFLQDVANGNPMEQQPNGQPQKSKGWPTWFPTWLRFLLLRGCILALLGYIASISYITVESFISVRSLPEGAYSTPKWSNFFPHF